jgi:hypothetical protein
MENRDFRGMAHLCPKKKPIKCEFDIEAVVRNSPQKGVFTKT